MDVMVSAALAAAAWEDIKERRISLLLCAFLAIAGVVNHGFLMILGVIPGILLLMVSRATGGAIGSGDGWFFTAAGLCLGIERTSCLFFGGSILCGCFSLVLLVIGGVQGKNMRHVSLPFLPFLLPVWAMMIAGERL